MMGHPMARVCRTLGISRSTAYRSTQARSRFYERAEDAQVLEEIRLLMSRAVEGRFPAGTTGSAVQWLSDNGSIYTALETQIHAERLGLMPVTTPARSPQSNGMSEAFVNTLRCD